MEIKLITICLLLTLLNTAPATETDGKCRALALRGGGDKGAYEIGVMKALISELKPHEYRYDVVVGVSIGALNAALFSTFEKGNEAEAVAYLENIWANTDSQDLWQWWPYVNIAGGLWYKSFLDSSPLHEKAAKWLANKTIKRKIGMQAVDINTGNVVMFDETVPGDLLAESTVASASIPGIFESTIIDGMVLVDGGVFTNLDLGEAVTRCREEVEKDEDIIVDIILVMDEPVKIKEWTIEEAKWKNAYQINQRIKEFKDYYYYYDDVYRVINGYPKVNFRYLFTPQIAIPSDYIPIFSNKQGIQRQINQGFKEGVDIIRQNKVLQDANEGQNIILEQIKRTRYISY